MVLGFLAGQMWPAGVTNTCRLLTRKAMCLLTLRFFREQVSLKKVIDSMRLVRGRHICLTF